MDEGDHAVLEAWRERIAAARRGGSSLRLRGAGTKDFYGEELNGDILHLGSWRGIIDYEPSELVISARCGTPLSEVEAALAAHEQFLAFEPPAFGGDPTLGGIIAAGLSGPRRMFAGAARDFVLGARLLTAQGDLLRFGGAVMKNVAGFDVSRLLCGSLGILGILTEVSLKVLPRPRLEETRRLELSAGQAVTAFNRWQGLPLPLSGAAWWQGTAWVRLSGATAAVRAARAQIGGDAVPPLDAERFWSALRHYQLPPHAAASVWRVSLPQAAPRIDVPAEPLIDWGGALRWYANVPPEIDMRERARAVQGTALHWRGAPPGKRFPPLPAAIASLHRRLKERFDPAGVFNRGRLIAGV
ncbi:MAG: glycolate oxidase subunit GlcE [Gammaproteobacteria bacterium]|nr:glycolate oxidase subunit GlcE [Gammaproteobacteria bacterium]